MPRRTTQRQEIASFNHFSPGWGTWCSLDRLWEQNRRRIDNLRNEILGYLGVECLVWDFLHQRPVRRLGRLVPLRRSWLPGSLAHTPLLEFSACGPRSTLSRTATGLSLFPHCLLDDLLVQEAVSRHPPAVISIWRARRRGRSLGQPQQRHGHRYRCSCLEPNRDSPRETPIQRHVP